MGNANHHNLRIQGSNNPQEVNEHMRQSPKLNVFYALFKQKVFQPFFFAEHIVTSTVYPHELEKFCMLISEEEDMLFQQEGAPPNPVK
jgi:hypothetical protein